MDAASFQVVERCGLGHFRCRRCDCYDARDPLSFGALVVWSVIRGKYQIKIGVLK